MIELKIGQVWKNGKHTLVITTNDEVVECLSYGDCCCIRNDGVVFGIGLDNINRGNYELLATYPTWQEAVNSKEFKGE
jgi:hypothetical protein